MPRTYLVSCLLSIFVACGGILFGYDTGTISGVQENAFWQQQFGDTLNEEGMKVVSTSQKAMLVSILSVGTFFGALAAAPFGDFLGRKWALFTSCWVFSVGVAMQTASTGLKLFTGGRVVAGFGVGLVSCLVPMYQAEAAPAHLRGAIIGVYQFAITIGLLIASVVNNACKDVYSPAGWQWVVSVQFIFAGVLGVGMIFLPDTPRSLIRRGNMEGAAKSLARLRSCSVDNVEMKAELDEIRSNLEYENRVGQASYLDCFRGLSLKRSLLGIFVQMFQQRNSLDVELTQSPVSTSSSTMARVFSKFQDSKMLSLQP
jgi:MFS transporter, SP family, sugar:H+ symporter